jgi:hypothetical protein
MNTKGLVSVVAQVTKRNKGSGAGGSGTNRSGKTFENDYDVCTHFKLKKTKINRNQKCLAPVEWVARQCDEATNLRW